jgi:hypothetical protein
MSNFGASLAALVLASAGFAQAPDGLPTGPPAPMSPVAAPRNDLFSTYTDAFMNPDCVSSANCETGGAMGGLFHGPRHYRVFFGYDQLRWGRTDAGNVVLTRTSANIFNGAFLNADPDTRDLYPIRLIDGLFSETGPNTPGNARVYFPNGSFQEGLGETVIPNQIRTQTDDFDMGREWGYRPKVGLEFEDGSRLMFSYFKLNDYMGQISDDVSGAALRTLVISSDDPAIFQFQRFGYLNTDFQTGLPAFGGERRRQFEPTPSPFPHNPLNENPSVVPVLIDPPDTFFIPTSLDVPREPTVNDWFALDDPAVENQVFPSGLFFDGEVMVANYAYDIQGADLVFEKFLNEWTWSSWNLFGIVGVKYLAMDEAFTLLFADIAPFGDLGGFGVQARSPWDRALANGFIPGAQPSNETVAITNVSVDNDIIGPSLGLRAVRPFCGVFEVDLMGKGSWGLNFLQRDSYLLRGDGLVGFVRSRNETLTSGVVEWQLGMNFVPHRCVKLRAGWEALWLINVGTAISNISFNLDRNVRPNARDSVLWHGWYFGGEFSF